MRWLSESWHTGVSMNSSSASMLICKQLLLAFNTPVITTKLAIVPYYAVAWDKHSDRISSAGLSNCSCRGWLPNSLGYLLIGTSLTYRNRSQRLPDFPLKGCSMYIE